MPLVKTASLFAGPYEFGRPLILAQVCGHSVALFPVLGLERSPGNGRSVKQMPGAARSSEP